LECTRCGKLSTDAAQVGRTSSSASRAPRTAADARPPIHESTSRAILPIASASANTSRSPRPEVRRMTTAQRFALPFDEQESPSGATTSKVAPQLVAHDTTQGHERERLAAGHGRRERRAVKEGNDELHFCWSRGRNPRRNPSRTYLRLCCRDDKYCRKSSCSGTRDGILPWFQFGMTCDLRREAMARKNR